MNLGEMGNFISYGFAPASVVAPLGTVCPRLACYSIERQVEHVYSSLRS